MIFAFDTYELDAERLELWRGQTLVKMEAVVLRLLIALVKNAGRLVTKDELVEEVWDGRAVADNVITVSMARLRKALDERRGAREFVATVYGRGYRFVQPVVVRGETRLGSLPPAEAPPSGPPFLGRDRVVARLRDAFAEARNGRGRLCVLLGEPGIGKTRVIEMLESELAASGTQIAWGYCREAGDTPPLSPFLQILRELTAEGSTSPLSATLQPELAGARESASRRRGFEAILNALLSAAKQHPRVLVFDDLHRADRASIELLSQLVDRVARSHLLVIATVRPAAGGRTPRSETHLPYVLGHRNCERIVLERLSEQDVKTYVATLLEDPDGKLGRSVYEKSEGNPFFMVELCRQLRDADKPSTEALAVPDAALELVRQHVARLDVEARGVLSAAAVIGRRFELSLLAGVTGRELSQLIGNLDDAMAAEVLVPAPHSVTAFAFGHELMRTVLYDGLSPAERRDLHLRTAEALEGRAQAGESVPASDLAYHYHAALPKGDPRKTIHYTALAAADAAAVFATPDVVRYLSHGLTAIDLLDKPSPKLRMRSWYYIAIYSRGHDGAGFARAVEELIRLAGEYENGDLLARGAALSSWHPGLKPLPGASAAAKRALTMIPEDNKGARGVALAALACAAPECFDAERSHALAEEALPLVRASGSRAALYAALIAKLHLSAGRTDEQEALATLDELERLAQQNPERLPVLPVDLAFHRAVRALTRGDSAAVHAAIQRAVVHARELHHGELLWHSERLAALAKINGADAAQGMQALSALHLRAAQNGILNSAPFCAFDRVVVCGTFAWGQPVDDDVRQSLAFEASDPPGIWAMKVRALATLGLREEASTALRAVAPVDLARLPCDSQYLGTLGLLARASLLLGATDYVRALYPLLARYPDRFAAHMAFFCEGAVPQLLGMLADALGQHVRAVAHFEAGLGMNERAGLLARAAEARVQLASSRKQAHARKGSQGK